MSEDYLTISDLQCPFEDSRALPFCKYLKRHYKIPDENILCVGDEVDQYWGGLWDKSPDADYTSNQEIAATKDKLRAWYDAFPLMKLCDSNHGSRWKRKAFAAQIPSQMMRLYQEVIESPPGWQWRKYWRIPTKHPFIIEHGDDWGGQFPHVAAAIHNGASTIMGHHHSKFGVHYIKTNHLDIWGCVAGCLIDFDTFAFEYARNAKFKPKNGAVVITNNGRMPICIPQF